MLQPSEPWSADLARVMAVPELEALAAVTARVFRRLRGLYVLLFGSISAKPSPSTVERRRSSAPDKRTEIKPSQSTIDFPQVWTDAVDNGLTEIIDAMDAATDAVHAAEPRAEVAKPLRERKAKMRAALKPAEVAKRGFISVQVAARQPEHLETAVRGAVSNVLVEDARTAAHAEARRRGDGWVLIWVPERDACVICTRLAGEHVQPGGAFNLALTYGAHNPTPWHDTEDADTLTGPPRHPFCRCELHVIHVSGLSSARDALQREARRSIAKGWALPSEGGSVRVKAAKRLLARGPGLPKTVVAETARRLKKPATFVRSVPS